MATETPAATSSPEAGGIDDAANGAAAPASPSTPRAIRPIPPSHAELEARRGKQLFGEGEAAADDPSAEMFGIRDFRAGKGGRQRQQSPNAPAAAAAARDRGRTPGAPAKATTPGANADASGTADATLAESAASHDALTEPEVEVPEGHDLVEWGGEAKRKVALPKDFAQYHRTLAGQQRGLEQRATLNANSAAGWKAHAETLQRELDAARNGSPAPVSAEAGVPSTPATASATAAAASKTLLESIDWNTMAEVHAKNPALALQWLVDAFDQVHQHTAAQLESKLRTEYESRLNPILGERAQMQTYAKAAEFFGDMSNVGDEAGRWYPELAAGNQQAIEEIASIWVALHPDEASRYSHTAFHTAYLHWRDRASRASRAPAAPAAAPSAPASLGEDALAALLSSSSADAARAAAVVGGASSQVSAPRPTSPRVNPGRGSALVDAISRAGSDPVHRKFGINR